MNSSYVITVVRKTSKIRYDPQCEYDTQTLLGI